MKILIKYQNIKRMEVMLKGLEMAKNYASTIGLEFEYEIKETKQKLTSFNTKNAQGQDIVSITPDFAEQGYKTTCLIFNDAQSTNPVHIPYNNLSTISIPENWYQEFPEVLAQYFLHEICHAGFWYANKPDITHNQQKYPQWQQKQSHEYYLYLLKDLKPFLDSTHNVYTTPILRIRSTNKVAVKELQTLLVNLVVDGDFGNKTLQSVIAFQKSKKLTADGVVGSKTWSELKKNSKLETPIFDLTKWKLTPEFERKAFQFLVIAKADGYNLKITSGRRTQAEQNALYEQGRTTQGAIVTWTRNSKHISGLAFDVAFVGATPYPNNFDWEILGKIGERIGLKWGGRFSTPDRPHFEL